MRCRKVTPPARAGRLAAVAIATLDGMARVMLGVVAEDQTT